MTSPTSDRYPDALRAGTTLGEFTITDVIGEGGFGTVYLAYEEMLDRTVAIKEYLPVTIASRAGDQTVLVRSDGNREAYAAGLQSFMREARLQARFSHPAMLEVYRVWEQNGTAYMAMRYYPGESLRELRNNTAASITIDEAWIKRTLLPVFDAVRELHSQSVLHRDVSPDNILILPSGVPVLLDFGAARMIVAGAAQSLTTVLKPGYAPIEQYAGDGAMEQGPWTDVYGLGAVLYFLAIGKPPPQAVTRMLTDTLPGFDESVSGRYSESFAHAIKRAIAVIPENRLQSVASLIEALGWDDAPEPQYPQTTNVTARVINADAQTAVERRDTAHNGGGKQPVNDADTPAESRGGLVAFTVESTRESPTVHPLETELRETAVTAPKATPAIALPSATPAGSRSRQRTGLWLLVATLLLGTTYLVFEKFQRTESTQLIPKAGTDVTPVNPPPLVQVNANPTVPAESLKGGAADGLKTVIVSPPASVSTQSRRAATVPKPKEAPATASQPTNAKSAADADVAAPRSGCERIFAKLSLGSAELTEAERQKLVACK